MIRARAPIGAPGGWVAVLPAWGDRATRILLGATLPALAAAVRRMPGRPVTVAVYTDRPEEVRAAYAILFDPAQCRLDIHPVLGVDGGFGSLSACHSHALDTATPSDRVLLLTADMVVSAEVLETCDRLMSVGKLLVCCVAMRALEDAGPPIGAAGRALLAWAWANRHPMTRECTWPGGRSYDVWRMYFEQGDEVAARVFLPHPLVCVPGGRKLEFRPTIDVNLTANFSQAVTHLITSPEEGAVVELSPPDKDFLLTTTMRERMTNTQHSCPPLIRCTNPRHRMFFGKKVVIRGAGGDCGDQEIVGKVL